MAVQIRAKRLNATCEMKIDHGGKHGSDHTESTAILWLDWAFKWNIGLLGQGNAQGIYLAHTARLKRGTCYCTAGKIGASVLRWKVVFRPSSNV